MVSKDSEKIVLGHLIKTQKIPIGLDQKDFGDKVNQSLFDILSHLIEAKIPIDFGYVASHYKETEQKRVIEYLKECESTSNTNIDETLVFLKELCARRFLKDLSVNLVQQLNDPTKNNLDIIAEIEDKLLKVPASGEIDNKIIGPEKYIEWRKKGLLDRMNHGTAFLGSGMIEIDEDLADGFSPKIVSVIAGETSQGKTTISTNAAKYISKRPDRKEHVLYFSPESTAMKIADRLDVQLTGIPMKEIQNIMQWEKGDPRFELLRQATVTQSSWRLHRLDVRGLSGRKLMSAVEVYKKRNPDIKVVFIDTLQDLAENIDWDEYGGSQNAALEKLMSYLEIKSYELDIHICLVSQFARSNDKKGKKYVPNEDRLRGSGSIGAKATWVLNPHRPFRSDGEGEDNQMDIWIVKNRDGSSMIYHSYEFVGSTFQLGNYIGRNQ